MNIEKFEIQADSLEAVKDICGCISDDELRQKAAANAFVIKAAKQFFEANGIDADCDTGIYNVPNAVSDIDIADIYIKNAYVDVRLCQSENALYVPKAHFDMNLSPSVYMFVSLTSDLKEAAVLGFVPSDAVDREAPDGIFYTVQKDALRSFDEIQMYLLGSSEAEILDDAVIYSYLENDLENKTAFLRSLISSQENRKKLLKAYNGEAVLKYISKTFDIPESVAGSEQADYDDTIENLSADTEDIYTEIEESSPILDVQEDFSTAVTPSVNEYEEENDESSLEEIAVEDTAEEEPPYTEVQELTEAAEQANEQIEALFPQDETEENGKLSAKRSSALPKIFVAVLILAIVGGGAFCGYNFYMQQAGSGESTSDYAVEEIQPEQDAQPKKTEDTDAMPVESVEKNNVVNENQNEGNAVGIPAIEQNLDASVLVSNLKVNWEVPAGYASNASAKRYLVKLGKIIQLNLKTELLLLSKPPISNNISVEIKFNNDSKKFETVGIVKSSGETTVDNLILETVNKVLNMNISVNTDSFGKLQGNPVLVIHL